MNAIHGAHAVDASAYETLEGAGPTNHAHPPTTPPPSNTTAPAPAPTGRSPNGPPPPSPGSPTSCARDAAQPDPNYQDPKAKRFANDAALIESYQGGLFNIGANDGKLSIEDVKNAAKNPNLPQGVREAAVRLLSEMETLQSLKGPDGLISREAIGNYVKNENAKGPKAETNSEAASGTAGGVNTGGTSDAAAPSTTEAPPAASADSNEWHLDIPNTSTTPGIGGACENLGAAQDSVQAQIQKELANLQDHPELAASISAKISNLTSQTQMLSNLQNQLMQMQQNISKMFSDISMNAIRNIR